MKRTGKIMIALLVIGAMLLSFAACGKKTDLMAGIFEKLQANAEYTAWKAGYQATAFEEKLDGNTITVTAAGEEGINGEFVFTLDGDYIVAEQAEGDYSTYSVLMFLKGALADYYGMNNNVMSGYIAGLSFSGKENTFFIVENSEGKTVFKLYAASAWDMQGLDEMLIDEQALEYADALTEDFISNYTNCGKLTAAAFGSKNDFTLFIGEYDKNTDLTLKSLQNIVAKMQPNGYEAFAEEYTELKDASGSGYTVTLGLSDETAQNHSYTAAEGYSYITAVFSADAGSADEDGQNPVMNFIGDYQADRCSIHVEAEGANDAAIQIHWGSSASESVEFTMSGAFDADTLRVNYSNSEKKTVTYDENGNVTNEITEYTDGVGQIQFHDDGTLSWQDEQEGERLADMTFTYVLTGADETEADGQNPVMNFVGTYADTTAGRCSIEIEAVGATDAKISVHWSSSAAESSNWTMSGTFDPDTLRINYTDAVRTDIVFDENEKETDTVVYEDGFGRIQFHGDGTLSWQDEKEAENLEGLTFAFAG